MAEVRVTAVSCFSLSYVFWRERGKEEASEVGNERTERKTCFALPGIVDFLSLYSLFSHSQLTV